MVIDISEKLVKPKDYDVPQENSIDESLDDWLRRIERDLFLARAIEIPVNDFRFIRNKLIEDRYPFYKRVAAEQWILKGDWRYKKEKILRLDDFYPSKAMIESLYDEFISIFESDKRIMEMQRQLQIQFNAQIDKIKSYFEMELNERSYKGVNKELRKCLLELYEMERKLAKYEEVSGGAFESNMLSKQLQEIKQKLNDEINQRKRIETELMELKKKYSEVYRIAYPPTEKNYAKQEIRAL